MILRLLKTGMRRHGSIGSVTMCIVSRRGPNRWPGRCLPIFLFGPPCSAGCGVHVGEGRVAFLNVPILDSDFILDGMAPDETVPEKAVSSSVHAKDDMCLHERPSLRRRRSVGHEDDAGDVSFSDSASTFSVVESLDLEPSLPYWLAYVRARMSEYAEDMERLVHTHHANRMGLLVPLEHIEARLGAAYAAVMRYAHEIPSPSTLEWMDRMPSRQDVVTSVYAMMHDWERRASTFHPSLFSNGTMSAPEWATNMPSTAAHLSEEVQRRVTYIREHVNQLTLQSLIDKSSEIAHEAQVLSGQMYPSDLIHRFEEKLEYVREHGRQAGAQIAHAVHDVEDALYHAALQLANGGRELISYHALPELWRNNDFIITGYRFIPVKNWKSLLYSMFQVHNETGNIHTHVAGLILVAALFWFTGVLDQHTTAMDRWIQTIYLLAAAKCLICSVTWHVMAGCSDLDWFLCFACLDYTGISWLVAASLETLVYNGFYCQPDLVAIYTVGVVALGLTMAILPWQPWFNDLKYRTIRISLFILMAMMGIVPFVHGGFLHGFGPMMRFFAPIIPSELSYIVGVIVYGFRFPERFAPGRFDIVGHSHQLWHIAIVLAIYFHYRAILLFHENRFEYSCAAGYTSSAWAQFFSHELHDIPRRVGAALLSGTSSVI